jgi:hypothetical protein
MVEYDVIHKKQIYTFNDLYQLGWNGDNRRISIVISEYLPTGYEIEELNIHSGSKTCTVDLTLHIKVIEEEIDSGIEEVPCPICSGSGEYEEYLGSHSRFVVCEYCNGTGKQNIKEVI